MLDIVFAVSIIYMAFTGQIGHLEGIESPWANAGGVVKTLEELYAMCGTGVGWVELGSITCEKREIQGPYFFNAETGEMFNRIGMNNRGLDEVILEIPEMVQLVERHNKKLVVNVALVSDNPEEEAVELVSRIDNSPAHAVLLNPDCPNLNSEVISKNPAKLFSILGELATANITKPIFLRIAPQLNVKLMGELCGGIATSGICSAVFISNSLAVEESPIGPAGKSGPAMARRGALETSWALTYLRGTGVDTVSSIAIANARELGYRLGAGAVAGAGTTFFYESQNGWQDDVDRLLTALAV